MSDSFGAFGEKSKSPALRFARRSARRAARQRRKLAMEEAVSGLPVAANSSPSSEASEDQSNGDAHPPMDVFRAFSAMGLNRDHCDVQTNFDPFLPPAPALGEAHKSPDYIGDVIFTSGPGEDEKKIVDLSREGGFDSDAKERDEVIDFFPNLNGQYSNNERQPVKPHGASNHEVQGLTPEVLRGKDLHSSEGEKKKYWLPLALLVSLLGIVLASSLAARKNAGDHELGFEVKNPKHHLTPATQTPTETSTFITHDLLAYGYPYIQGTSSTGWVGWVTWLPGRRYEGDDPNHVSYDASVGISSLEDCAAMCQKSQAPTASWSEKYKTCWCNFANVTNLCREPCVGEEYIDFGIVPFHDIHYCRKSVCEKDWYLYDSEYCEADVGFDQDTCDAKKEDIGRA